MKLSKSTLSLIVVLAVVGCVAGVKLALQMRQASQQAHLERTWRARGNPQAPIKVIEFTDFQCPACANAVTAIDDVLKRFPDRIYFEHKYYPLPMHSFSKRAAIYAECAAEQGKFWPYHDVLFRSQQSWSKMASVEDYFAQLAVSLGVDGLKLSVCVGNPLTLQRVDRDVIEGKNMGVNSTPTFFVNKKMAVGVPSFKRELDNAMANYAQ